MSQDYAYYLLILKGERTIDEVPSAYRNRVSQLLIENGQSHYLR